VLEMRLQYARMLGRLRHLALLSLIACSSPPKPVTEPSKPAGAGSAVATPAKPKKLTPVGEKAELLREAASNLDKAQTALDGGNKNLAEQLFSFAELVVGPDALASIAPTFREGAPPRITTAPVKLDEKERAAPPQPKAVGNSEDDDVAAKVPPPKVVGSLTGTMTIDSKAASGAFGLVTLEPANGKWKPRTPKRVVLEQRNREFLPHLMAVSVGTTVSFPNFDGVFHNVFSTSPLGMFDLGLYKQGEAREYKFEREGILRLGCNLHANMSAYIAVVSAPAYVVTDDKGNFAFKYLAPGKYKLKAWSERSKAPIVQDITITAGANTVNVGVTGDADKGAMPDKFGGKRG